MGGTQATRSLRSGADGELTEDELFELLSNQRRRHVLHVLLREDGPVELGPLAQEVAAWEVGVDYDQVSSADRKRVYTSLQQIHLPKMDRMGVLAFDSRRGRVEPAPAIEDVQIHMDVVYGRDRPWSEYYLGLAVLAGAVYVVAVTDVGPGPWLSSPAWGAFVVVALGSFALAHRYAARRDRLGTTETPPDVELTYDEAD